MALMKRQPRGPKKFRSKNNETGKDFWDKEYSAKRGEHLAMSTEPSEDLEKFTRWLERQYGREFLNPLANVLDLGCGNGRNVVYLAENFGLRGTGYDISTQAIVEAKKLHAQVRGSLPLSFAVRSLKEGLPLPDDSQTIVLDMMVSHFLSKDERKNLIKEIFRVLKPGGWLFMKTFLRDEDIHVERLLREYPADEAGSYIHPEIGVAEHTFHEEEILEDLSPFFVHKITKSHRHKADTGSKRRSMSIYAQKVTK
jgi:SAM-dependent methyltransferase